MSSKEIDSYIEKGNENWDNEEFDKALNFFNKAISIVSKDDKKHSELLKSKGRILMNFEKYEDSIKCFDESFILEPNVEALELKGGILDLLERDEEALKCYNKGLKLYPEYVPLWQLKGENLFYNNDNIDAEKCFDRVLELEPENVEALNYKGLILLGNNENTKSLSYFEEAIKHKSEYFYPWYNAGTAYYNLNHYKKAIEYIDKALKINDSDSYVWILKGDVQWELNKHQDAIKSYNKAIELDSQNPEAFASKGAILWFLDKYDESMENLDKSLTLDPEYLYPLIIKGKVYRAIEKPEKALNYFDKVLNIDKEYADAWYQKGNVFNNLGKTKEAIKNYKNFVKYAPEDMKVIAKRVDKFILDGGKGKETISLSPPKKPQYWQWSTKAEYFLNADGTERTDLEPSNEAEADPGLWWTCHKDTRVGDLILLYRAGTKKGVKYQDIKYLIQATSNAYTVDEDEFAFEHGWQYGCDYRSLFKFENSLKLEEMRKDPYLNDWNALGALFRMMAYRTEERHWNRLNDLLKVKNSRYEDFLNIFKPQKVIANIKSEKEVEDKLVENLNILKKFGYDLKLEGRQVICKGQGGYIDLLCKDNSNGDYVVIELKIVPANRNVFGQIADYMGWVMKRLANNNPVKGIVISDGYDNSFDSALRTNRDINHIGLTKVLSELGMKLK